MFFFFYKKIMTQNLINDIIILLNYIKESNNVIRQYKY